MLKKERLIELFEVHGQQQKVARAIGVDNAQIKRWRMKYGLRLHTVLRPINQEEKSQDSAKSGS